MPIGPAPNDPLSRSHCACASPPPETSFVLRLARILIPCSAAGFPKGGGCFEARTREAVCSRPSAEKMQVAGCDGGKQSGDPLVAAVAADVTGRTGKTAVGSLGGVSKMTLLLPLGSSPFPAFTCTALEANVHTLLGESGCSLGFRFSHRTKLFICSNRAGTRVRGMRRSPHTQNLRGCLYTGAHSTSKNSPKVDTTQLMNG